MVMQRVVYRIILGCGQTRICPEKFTVSGCLPDLPKSLAAFGSNLPPSGENRSVVLFGQESIESALPAGGGVGKINKCVCAHFIPPAYPE